MLWDLIHSTMEVNTLWGVIFRTIFLFFWFALLWWTKVTIQLRIKKLAGSSAKAFIKQQLKGLGIAGAIGGTIGLCWDMIYLFGKIVF